VRRWLPLIILAAAQFVMVLDSSVMNVSISQIVDDLDTTVTGVQSAITLYTLVMAAFMLVGAKLGDIWGRDRTFGIGLAVYGLGSAITSISPSLTVLLVGWSLIEGLGAVLVIPAIAALIAANYEGKDRALAYGLIGGAAGAAIAAGPLIGGFVTTYFSWRYVFVGEVVVVAGVLIVHRRMKRAPKPEHPPRLDLGGAALSAAALGLVVFGILKSSSWGWVAPLAAPTIAGHEITPFGFSVVPFLIVGGLGTLVSSFAADPTAAPPVSGPVGIATQLGDIFWGAGPILTLYVAAILSANLAVVNILPFPPLDGGRMLMLTIKALFGARISLRAEQLTYMVGFVFLFAFIIWITGNDIIRGLGGT